MVQLENRQQAADQVSISNSIGSLRLLAMTDWREFVETMRVVDKTLRDDPAATYGRMDFATRDRYRHVVERLARRGKLDECDVARGALRLAREAAGEEGGEDIRAHSAEERRVGEEGVRTCRSRWAPGHRKTN